MNDLTFTERVASSLNSGSLQLGPGALGPETESLDIVEWKYPKEYKGH